MWHDDLPPGKPWTSLWSNYILCSECLGIRMVETPCPTCESPPCSIDPTTILVDGKQVTVRACFPGAEGRYEDYVYLQMLEREWKRPVTEVDELRPAPPGQRPSARAAIVVLFWSYFETRLERLLRAAMRDIPPRLSDDILQRYSSIGARLDRLYRVLFETSYAADLAELGYDDIWRHLALIQERRNAFAHGTPGAIDDALVRAVVDNLAREHESWIAVFNRRGTRRTERRAC